MRGPYRAPGACRGLFQMVSDAKYNVLCSNNGTPRPWCFNIKYIAPQTLVAQPRFVNSPLGNLQFVGSTKGEAFLSI